MGLARHFFYVDPPYPGCHQSHYNDFMDADFEKLIAALKSVKGSFILSNYDHPAVPKEWERFENETITSATKGGVSQKLRSFGARLLAKSMLPRQSAFIQVGRWISFSDRP